MTGNGQNPDTPPIGAFWTRLFFESADEVLRDLVEAVADNEKVGVETVLSSDKYRVLVENVSRNEDSPGAAWPT
jgi:hypothetical protein